MLLPSFLGVPQWKSEVEFWRRPKKIEHLESWLSLYRQKKPRLRLEMDEFLQNSARSCPSTNPPDLAQYQKTSLQHIFSAILNRKSCACISREAPHSTRLEEEPPSEGALEYSGNVNHPLTRCRLLRGQWPGIENRGV